VHRSAFRESSFGFGLLTLFNDTHALYNWSRSACEAADTADHITYNASCESITWNWNAAADNSGFSRVPSDTTWIVRNRVRQPPQCAPPNEPCYATRQPLSPPPSPTPPPPAPPEPPPAPPPPSPPSPHDCSFGKFSTTTVIVAAVCGALSGVLLVLITAALPRLLSLRWTRRHVINPKVDPKATGQWDTRQIEVASPRAELETRL